MPNKITYSDREIVEKLLSNDSTFEAYFFLEMCKPLLSKISYTIFDNLVPINELTNEFLCLLKENNWAKLKSFHFQSTLFGWLKVVAVHFFNSNKERLYPNYIYAHRENTYSILHLETTSKEEILSLLQRMTISQYYHILYMVFIEERSDDKIADMLCLSTKVYKRKKKFAIEHLKFTIMNAGPYYEQSYLKQECINSKHSEDITSTSEHELWITKMDVVALINLMPNDRYRHVIRSLVIEEKERTRVATEMGITIENLDNIKCRALKQLAKIARKEML